MRTIVLAALLAAAAIPALAQGAPGKPDPAQRVLMQMLQDAQGREARALLQVYAINEQMAEMDAKLKTANERADAAEAKLKAAPEAKQ
jgi:hypothetical protein